jgi:hypothetical protein
MKILGANYEVKYMTQRDSNDSGDCDWRFQIIRLQDNYCTEALLETLIHEVIEAINIKLQLELPHPAITSLASSIFAVMNDNGIDLKPLLPANEGF